MSAVTCPLCQRRRARRACPALGHQICALCCGTKRMTEIQCPTDCGYLASAKAHPPATTQRQQTRDIKFLYPIVAELDQRQVELFFLVQNTCLGLANSGELRVDDEVVRDAARALAATYETESKGIIYEHRPASLDAERLSRELTLLFESTDGERPVGSKRDIAAVLTQIEQAAARAQPQLGGDNRAYLSLIDRMMRLRADTEARDPDAPAAAEPSIIIP